MSASRTASGAPPRPLIHAIVFIEGFCSLGAEVIALRQIVPHLGSSITVTAPTIGLFLLALALGYQTGARIGSDYLVVVARNFLLAALLAGGGLAGVAVDLVFASSQSAVLAYLLHTGLVLCPLAWLLGQTVPLLTNLMRHERPGESSGYALYYSTLGSFLGSVTLSLLVMQWLGVSAAVSLCAGLLLLGFVLLHWWPGGGLNGLRPVPLLGLLAVAAVTALGHLWPRPGIVIDTAYASYRVEPVELPGMTGARALRNNNSYASLIDASEPPRYARYIRRLRELLLEDLAWKDRDVLVLGAGGFTLSHREPLNRYTYVDIDPAMQRIAETQFLHEPIRGRFIADDARRFVATSTERFDAVLVDVYSSHTAIPGHLVTQEFWRDARRVLKPDGLLIANLLLDPALASPYARRLLATIESVHGRCAVEVLLRHQPLGNVLVICHAGAPPEPDGSRPELYTDERNRADFDLWRSR